MLDRERCEEKGWWMEMGERGEDGEREGYASALQHHRLGRGEGAKRKGFKCNTTGWIGNDVRGEIEERKRGGEREGRSATPLAG